MGIQIYIKKAALAARDIQVTIERPLCHSGCHCQMVMTAGQYCEDCGTYAEDWEEAHAHVAGLSVVMGDFGETLWHDANHWGPSRAPIMEFIDKHQLRAGEEWYEA